MKDVSNARGALVRLDTTPKSGKVQNFYPKRLDS
jgi:hypothetical protein